MSGRVAECLLLKWTQKGGWGEGGKMGVERWGNGVTGYRFGSEVLNIPVWERMKEGETHYWNFRCPEILRLKLRGKIGKSKKINSTT